MNVRAGRASALALASVFAFAASLAAEGRNPGWWPGGIRPPFAALSGSEESNPRALLLGAASFRTDARTDLDAAIPEVLRGAPVAQGGWLIVQFRAEYPAASRTDILARYGAAAIDPLPRSAWLAHVPPASVATLAADPAVAWIGRFHPAYKLSPLLGEPLPGEPEASAGSSPAWKLRLRLAPGADPEAVRAAADAAGASVIEAWPGGARAVAADASALVGLARCEDVLFIEDDAEPSAFNDQSRGICQSGNPAIASVHDHGVRGGGQIVAVMDTGIDTKHCCFSVRNKIADNRAWGGGTVGASCGDDHGSHVSGTAACSNGGDHDGLAPDARIVMQDIQSSGSLQCLVGSVSPPNPLTPAWTDAKQKGAHVHTNSWGGGGNAYADSTREIDEFMWNNPDFLILFAAGNSGPGAGSLGNYSNAKNSITVGGTVNGSAYEDMYGGSSRGPAGDGRMLPDLLAPAQGVSSVDNQSQASCGWVTFTGTSMATPAVAGSAILVRDFFVRGYYPRGTATAADGFEPSAALVKASMLISTRDMRGSGTNGPRPNTDQGFGRLTLDDALWFSGDATSSRMKVLDDRNASTGLTSNGQEDVYQLHLREAAPLKVMLAWTDAPGATSAAHALVNDLDLVVETSDGKTYYGNQGFSGGWTTLTAATGDRLNNKEAVFLFAPLPGTVTVRVRAFDLGNVTQQKPQDYALVALGPLDPLCSSAPPAGVGDTATVDPSNPGLKSSWADRAADSYVVYRGTTPDFMSANPAPYREGVHDEDPATPGVQWTDPAAYGDGITYYYLFNARNACGEQAP